MFPVYMKKPGTTPPDANTYYIVAKNGQYLCKKSWWADAIVPVKQIAILEEQKAEIKLKLPTLSAVMLTKVWRFFQAVFKENNSEAAVLLHYSPTLGWEMTVPVQTATFSHVDYKMTDRLNGYVFVGTMHSHSSMSAFHSGTDIGDEAQVDGVHITLGHLNEPDQFSMDAEVVVNGTRSMLSLDFLEGVSVAPEKPKNPVVKYLYPITAVPRYTITCPEMDKWEVPADWMKKVTKSRVWVPAVAGGNGWEGFPLMNQALPSAGHPQSNIGPTDPSVKMSDSHARIKRNPKPVKRST